MKKKALAVLTMTGILLVQALASAGPSAAADERVITKTVLRGEGVSATFDRTDGCIHTLVGVFGNVFTATGATAQDNVANVVIAQIDDCQGKFLVEGIGEASTFDQVVKNDLSTATLKMAVNFRNFANGTVVPVTVNMSFRATAKATTTFVRDVSVSEGVRLVTSAGTKSRTGLATGTVTFGAQSVVSPDASSVTAQIDSAVTKEKTKDRP